MTIGTVAPLPILLLGYLFNVTIVGAPIAWKFYEVAIFTSTLGQKPPGEEKLEARATEKHRKPLITRLRPYSPPGLLEKRGLPVPMWQRIIWFILVGWWLGALWTALAWSVLLLPYPFLDMIREILSELPSVMTLSLPTKRTSTPGPPEAPH